MHGPVNIPSKIKSLFSTYYIRKRTNIQHPLESEYNTVYANSQQLNFFLSFSPAFSFFSSSDMVQIGVFFQQFSLVPVNPFCQFHLKLSSDLIKGKNLIRLEKIYILIVDRPPQVGCLEKVFYLFLLFFRILF